MTEIVRGLDIREVAEGGAVFELAPEAELLEPTEAEKEKEKKYQECLSQFTKLECLDFGKVFDGNEPFENIAKKMTDLLENGKIKKRILRQGYGAIPEESSNVNIHYNAYVQFEAHPFDSTYARKEPFSFVIGDGEVIEGLEIAVKSMKLNEQSQFLIHPDLAYRSGGLDRIPANSTVLFEIELCEICESVPKVSTENEKDFAHVYKYCLALCVQGKKKFRLKDYDGAIKQFKLAVVKLEEAHLNDYDEQLKSEELLVRLYTNLLVCNTHSQRPKKGCLNAQKIYEMSKNKTFKISAKVYFNHSKCLRMLGDLTSAERKLDQAKQIDPRNPEILQELASIRKEKEESRKREAVFGKALLSA